MVIIEVACRYCNKTHPVRKHGTGRGGFPRYYCNDCKRTFQLSYSYQAHQPGMREKIVEMASSGTSIRRTSSTLKVGINTVMRYLKEEKEAR